MPREKRTDTLKSSDYKIDGNLIRAFYDKRGKLVFVLDSTINNIKPNVLLVMAAYGDRKWDDVLSNDYGMDLELVRPKKDNKYQKLDVEYQGLVVYDNLIRAYQDKKNLKKALQDLQDFRAMSARRSASERLAAATTIAENARETIERTSDVIVELQAKIKAARSKVTSLRRNVGREPTKQSAAKILKAEAQLDVLTGKLERAKKRLENANKRLLAAEDDIEAAQKVLDLVPNVRGKKFKTEAAPVVAPARHSVRVPDDEPDDESDDEEEIDDNGIEPLFDQDPNILDEKIAFKPIDFDESPIKMDEPVMQDGQDAEVVKQESVFQDDDEVIKEEPIVEQKQVIEKPVKKESVAEKTEMSFVAPKTISQTVQVPDNYNEPDDAKLDDIYDSGWNDKIEYESDTPDTEITENIEVKENNKADVAIDLSVNDDKTSPVLEQDAGDPEIVASDVSEGLSADLIKPDTPKTVVDPAPVAPVPPVAPVAQVKIEQHHKPGLLYYILLLVLIILSVFTLWLYQRSGVSRDATPSLSPDTVVSEQVDTDENPFVSADDSQTSKTETDNKSVAEKVVGGTLDKIAKATQKPEVNETVTIGSEPTIAETAAGDNDNVVVIDEDVDKPEYVVTPEVDYDGATPGEETLCSDGTTPDTHGCCTGETYTDMGDQGFNCCPADGGDCFPPIEM